MLEKQTDLCKDLEVLSSKNSILKDLVNKLKQNMSKGPKEKIDDPDVADCIIIECGDISDYDNKKPNPLSISPGIDPTISPRK